MCPLDLCIVNERWKESREVGEIELIQQSNIMSISGCRRKNYWVSTQDSDLIKARMLAI